MDGVTLISGEGRFRWLHVRPGAIDDVVDDGDGICTATWPGCARRSRSSTRAGWAACPSAEVAARLGDVALVPFAPTAFLDPADTGELRLEARHGSLTPAEMLVPLLGWRGRVSRPRAGGRHWHD